MKAVVQDRYGSPDVLELRNIDRPVFGDNDVLIRVHAAGLDPSVLHLMTGTPYLVRLMGYGLRRPKSAVRGNDVAGRIEAVGANVAQLRPGDEVFGVCAGSFAEYARARQDKVAPKPTNLTFEQAAAVPISGFTALQALRDKGNVRDGDTVLITGAGGGVGTFAVQLAKVFGADVTGVCSTSKVELVRSIGADAVIDYTREDFVEAGRRYDLIVDTAGNRSLARVRRALAPEGTLVMVGGEGGGRWLGGVHRLLGAMARSRFGNQKFRGMLAKESQEDLLMLKDLIEAGKITPVIGRTYPLAEATDAIRYVAEGHARGKTVLTI
jgi:NADPH:quinone reductase-like Zn-dependent oxidoreductase